VARILIVDDERLLVKGLKRSLEQEKFEVTAAYDGRQAWDLIKEYKFELIILDIMLPEIDGLELCKMIRQSLKTPIIMLTAKGEDVDKIVGLELGADDYLSKPFNTRELLARIKAVLRRVPPVDKEGISESIVVGSMVIDPVKRRVAVNGNEINLTAKEFDLLILLARHPGRVYTRDNLLDLVWGSRYYSDLRTVDVHIRRLREKIEENPKEPEFILTKWGIGYYFNDYYSTSGNKFREDL